MAKSTTKEELGEWCLRRLGKPVINIEVTEEQIDDRIDEALELFAEMHYDGHEEKWVYYELTADDIANGYITLPEEVMEVIQVMPVHELLAHQGMFSYKYQVAVQALHPWQVFDSMEYFMRMTNYENILDMTSVTPTFEHVRHGRILRINRDLSGLPVGYKMAVKITSAVEATASLFNDKWLKDYVTALIKRQWGENTKKFADIQMLGGVTISGKELFEEAKAEVEALEEELKSKYTLPIPFLFG